nr:MAG TPA: Get5 C-terminal domain [Caudoviricetes sp.]
MKANITNTGVYTCVRLSRVDGSDSREILSRIKMGWEI